MDRGADDVLAANGNGRMLLHDTVRKGRAALTRLHLLRGADLSAVASDGATPLHAVMASGEEALARLLAAAGAPLSL